MKKLIISFGAVVLALAAQASTVYFDIKASPSSTWFTASTYRPNYLQNNSVINGWYWTNGGPSAAQCYRYDYGSYIIYRMVILNVPAGFTYFANVRNNKTGNMQMTKFYWVGGANDVVYMGQVTP